MITLIAGLLVAVVCSFLTYRYRLEDKNRARKKEQLEDEKNSLKRKVQAVVDAELKRGGHCHKVVTNEITRHPCERYTCFKFRSKMGDVVDIRVPITLWNALRLCTLFRDSLTNARAERLERNGAPFGTAQFIEMGLEMVLLENGVAKKNLAEAEEYLNKVTMANYSELAQELSQFGEKLSERTPGLKPVEA